MFFESSGFDAIGFETELLDEALAFETSVDVYTLIAEDVEVFSVEDDVVEVFEVFAITEEVG